MPEFFETGDAQFVRILAHFLLDSAYKAIERRIGFDSEANVRLGFLADIQTVTPPCRARQA
jgi:hypothetical protein